MYQWLRTCERYPGVAKSYLIMRRTPWTSPDSAGVRLRLETMFFFDLLRGIDFIKNLVRHGPLVKPWWHRNELAEIYYDGPKSSCSWAAAIWLNGMYCYDIYTSVLKPIKNKTKIFKKNICDFHVFIRWIYIHYFKAIKWILKKYKYNFSICSLFIFLCCFPFLFSRLCFPVLFPVILYRCVPPPDSAPSDIQLCAWRPSPMYVYM